MARHPINEQHALLTDAHGLTARRYFLMLLLPLPLENVSAGTLGS